MATSVQSVTERRATWLLRTLVPAILVGLALASAGCGAAEVEADDPRLVSAGGRVIYNGKPFSGVVRSVIPALNQINRTRYKDGFQHGISTEESVDGQPIASRRYFRGIKHGMHRTWFRNGRNRSLSTFYLGVYRGDAWMWHPNGTPSDYIRYAPDGTALLAKRWRRTGQIYMNTVFVKGAALGLPPSKVCDPIGPLRGKALSKIRKEKSS